MKTILILFDIDGTLLTSGGAGEYALKQGFFNEFGLEEDLSAIEIAGRTDSGIALQVLRKHGLDPSPDNVQRFYRGYLSELGRQLPIRKGRVLPGIASLVCELQSRSHVALGLLTGNLRQGADLKLKQYGLAGVFSFGAFADDHHDRNYLGPVALSRASAVHGCDFESARTYVIGDTEHDIACARACGARAVAVATGNFDRESLAQHNPDALFTDLSDVNKVLRALGLP